jgi:hypothetical protein
MKRINSKTIIQKNTPNIQEAKPHPPFTFQQPFPQTFKFSDPVFPEKNPPYLNNRNQTPKILIKK